MIPQAVLQETFCCPRCVEVFSSYQQMATHRAARRGFRNLASFYAIGPCCMACAREFHHSKALFYHFNYVRTGCLCTWACFSLPCAMPVAVRHAGRGADSLLASNRGFLVTPMRISAPMLPVGDLQTLADMVCYYREHLHLQPEEPRTCILAWIDAVDSLLARAFSVAYCSCFRFGCSGASRSWPRSCLLSCFL